MHVLTDSGLQQDDGYDPRELRLFRVISLRNRLIGEWAAGLMDLRGDDAASYADVIVAIGLRHRGEAEVADRLIKDFAERGNAVSAEDILGEMSALLILAEDQVAFTDSEFEAEWPKAA